MQTEKLPNNTVIVNTNQIKLNTYPDFLKENNLNLKRYLLLKLEPITNPDTF